MIVKTNVAFPLPLLFDAVTLMLNGPPALVGVPEITQLLELIDNPEGRFVAVQLIRGNPVRVMGLIVSAVFKLCV